MKFVFESDMKKGQCYVCPLCEYDHFNNIGSYHCAIDHSEVSFVVDRQDCPLEEYHGIEWHPYPKEKPQRDDIYLISVEGRDRTDVGYWFGDEDCWSNEDAVKIGCEDWLAYAYVIAWAEMPRPYEEEA